MSSVSNRANVWYEYKYLKVELFPTNLTYIMQLNKKWLCDDALENVSFQENII